MPQTGRRKPAPKKRPVVKAARESKRFAPEALNSGTGTFRQRINRAAASLPPKQAKRLQSEAASFIKEYRSSQSSLKRAKAQLNRQSRKKT